MQLIIFYLLTNDTIVNWEGDVHSYILYLIVPDKNRFYDSY